MSVALPVSLFHRDARAPPGAPAMLFGKPPRTIKSSSGLINIWKWNFLIGPPTLWRLEAPVSLKLTRE